MKTMMNVMDIRRLLMIVVAAMAMEFGVAQANIISTGSPIGMITRQASAQSELQVDVTGILDNDERGAASNILLDFYVGASAFITSLKWDVNVTSYDGSYVSEMKVTFGDTLGNGVTFTPGNGDDFAGTADYARFQDLSDLGQQFQLGIDGILRLEFHDGYKDLAFDEPEGIWNFGKLTFGIAEVPEPPTYAMIAVGLLLLAGVVRRRHGHHARLAGLG
ncbi:PEP-CTERM sorting domain-containing protein [Undibacterium sp. Xuan67W]|uniref:PEP-CTERM sorting domain-containing protein n=1 Tax=Undibacterium sp. Xuan67W TaxID=3413057 RepID=UPI003BF42336